MSDFVPHNRRLREVLIFLFHSKKTAELEALLDENQCQTQEELASALGETRQAISKRLHALGMIQKQGTWVPYDLKPRDVESFFRL